MAVVARGTRLIHTERRGAGAMESHRHVDRPVRRHASTGRRRNTGLADDLTAAVVARWLGSRVFSVSGNSLIGKLFTPVVPLFTKQRNWQQPS